MLQQHEKSLLYHYIFPSSSVKSAHPLSDMSVKEFYLRDLPV